MTCPFCGYNKPHKHGKTSKGTQRYRCPNCQNTFVASIDSVHYRRKVSPEKIESVMQAYKEGNSLRGIARMTKLAFNTVTNLVHSNTNKAQMVSNQEAKQVDTNKIEGDEMWSFVARSRSDVSHMS